jgi:hypothetical protein
MTTVEFVTLTVSCIGIGAAVVSVVLFVLYTMLQRRLILRGEQDSPLPEDTAAVMRLFDGSFKDDLPDDHREVLKAVVQRYSRTSLTSVLDDPTERSYLLEALADPSRVPWESEGQHGQRST